MKTYDLLLTAGVETRLTIDYNFFLVLADGGFTFDVALFKGSGFQPCEGVSAGFGVRLNEYRGKEFIFKSANTQTIKVFVGNDEAIYQRLSGTVTINGGNLASVGTLTTLTGIANTVKTLDDGITYGAAYKSTTGSAINTANVIFTPAANVNGAVLHCCEFLSEAGTAMAFLTNTATPTTPTDGDVLCGPSGYSLNSSVRVYFGKRERPINIPAGKGLWFYSSAAEANYSSRSALYTLK